MFIAGDPSGDIHAAPVIRELRRINPDIELWGIGGPQMTLNGFNSLMPFEPFNKMGFIEVAKHIRFFLNAKKFLIDEMKARRPDCLICVDYPGFNMPMMKAAKELGIPVVWYIAPMVWAWKKKRAIVLARNSSHIACIFPFEVEYFSPYTKNVSFVGNPSAEALRSVSIERKAVDNRKISILLVPGSRKQEVDRMLKPMLDAFRLLRKEYPDISATVSVFHTLDKKMFGMISEYDGVSTSSESLTDLFNRADVAIVKSGTSTLEAAFCRIPFVIAYRTSEITYRLAKMLVKVKYIGLPNIIANEAIVPECIQDDMTAAELYRQINKFLTDKDYYKSAVAKLSSLSEKLGEKKPSVEVAGIINNFIGKAA